MTKINVITIDGPSASGKGALALRLANNLGFKILDSGALYRLYAYFYKMNFSSDEIINQIKMNIIFNNHKNRLSIIYKEEYITHELRSELIAKIASEVNATVENIGARRLHTIIEKILDEISFTATDRSGEKIIINEKYINENLDNLVKDTDLSKFIL